MSGQTFQLLDSCTLLKPVDPHTVDQAGAINLPVCMNIVLQTHAIRILAAFHAPLVNEIKIECNQWSIAHANLELGRVWSQRCDRPMMQPKVLSLEIRCSDRPLIEALQLLSFLSSFLSSLIPEHLEWSSSEHCVGCRSGRSQEGPQTNGSNGQVRKPCCRQRYVPP
jgi:hypothetical protein